MYIKISSFLFCLALLFAFEASANPPTTSTGRPLPRFVSLRANEVNLRTGPGTRYPIEWVFRQQGLPLEITEEYDVWRRVRDWEGTQGWVHQSTLSRQRTAIVKGPKQKYLRANKSIDANFKALLDPGAIGKLIQCETKWCQIQFKDVKGFMLKGAFWGAYRGEQFD